MLKRILLFLFTGVLVFIVGGLAFLYWRKPAQAPASPAKVAMTAERIARGRYLFERVADCGGCHSERGFTRVGGPVVPGHKGWGNIVSDFLTGLPGVVVASNITSDRETGIGSWTDGEKIRAIREGVDKNGSALFPMVPYTAYRFMSDADVEAVVAYLNTLPPVRHRLPKTRVEFPFDLLVKFAPQPADRVPSPMADPLQYGKYLVTMAGCGECHTPKDKNHRRLPGMDFAGGEVIATKAGTVLAANITPGMDTGIGKWSPEFFQKKITNTRSTRTMDRRRWPGRKPSP
jgi:mono/diheme cytochrome c family protein